MSGVSALSARHSRQRIRRYALTGLAVAAAIAAIAADTKVVKTGSGAAAQAQGFSVETYGDKTFPDIKRAVESRAVEANELAAALKADPQAAIKKYGVGATLPVMAVRFQGAVGDEKAGIFSVAVPGLPEGWKIRLQTGPVLTGTELRDATGSIQFGDFTNQIEYQNAGAALNRTLKATLLDTLDRQVLPGKQVAVVGVFRLLTPNNWLVTPVSLEVK